MTALYNLNNCTVDTNDKNKNMTASDKSLDGYDLRATVDDKEVTFVRFAFFCNRGYCVELTDDDAKSIIVKMRDASRRIKFNSVKTDELMRKEFNRWAC
jgi:hypothetical protein